MRKFRDCTRMELLIMNAIQDHYDPELVEEICDRAGLSDAYAASHGDSSADGGETFESVLNRAVEILEDEEGL